MPWGHNLRILDRIKDRGTRKWLLRTALEHGWSQNLLAAPLEAHALERDDKGWAGVATNQGAEAEAGGSRLLLAYLLDHTALDFRWR